MNKLDLIKKELEEGAGYNFDNWDGGDLQMLEEIVIATEIVIKKSFCKDCSIDLRKADGFCPEYLECKNTIKHGKKEGIKGD